MTATVTDRLWDFSQVLELVNSLDPKNGQPTHHEEYSGKNYDELAEDSLKSATQGLGDFSKIFHHLGTPILERSVDFAVQPPASEEAGRSFFLPKDEYASDGAVYSKSSLNRPSKNVQFEDQTSNEDPATTDAASDSTLPPDSPTLTKSQRKKRNRRERRAKEAAAAEERVAKAAKAKASVSESEAEVAKKAPARKASSHAFATPPPSRYNFRPRDTSNQAITSIANDNLQDAVSIAIEKVSSAKKSTPNHSQPVKHSAAKPVSAAPITNTSDWTPSVLDVSNWPEQPAANSTSNHGSTKFVPSTVRPRSNSAAKRSPLLNHATPAQPPSAMKHPITIEPITIRSGEDRHWALLIKLIRDFYEDRRHLIAPMNLTTHNNDPKGIHVFVDASNIFIGFNDQLKIARGIHPQQSVPAVGLSFDALALLIERRRPVAKRVLVGSTPHLPAFDKAKAVGYECSILEKVYKAKELTERQIYFKDLDLYRRNRRRAPPVNNVATANGGGNGSGSETNTPQYAPARMIEQGVDEILHLKILESVVDAEEPGTIVLATGDAAQAEYSEGFMAMAERALKKGWTVELVSWSKNISNMYTRRAWTETWGDRFKIAFLDDYAEELLDM